jgi:hypothetical protein
MRIKVTGRKKLGPRRSKTLGGGKTQTWAVATPLCAACQPPNALRRRGSLPPVFFLRLVAPSLAFSKRNRIQNTNQI